MTRPDAVLPLAEYRSALRLDAPFVPAAACDLEERPRLLRSVIEFLREEGPLNRAHSPSTMPGSAAIDAQWCLLRRLLTVRGPAPLPADIHEVIDQLLQFELRSRRIDDAQRLPRSALSNRAELWQGDITVLRADAIVNAANSEMLGCFQPFHACIDNAIHAAAGPRLREDCGQLMALQGRREPTGHAKATRGYNLPSRYVLHTVGPIVEGRPGPEHEAALASCYRACLDLAFELGRIRTIAFCAISTGVFGYPKEPAAEIAVHCVEEWLTEHPGSIELVIFNVFSAGDRDVYERVLGRAGDGR